MKNNCQEIKKIFITVNELIYFRCREYIVINWNILIVF